MPRKKITLKKLPIFLQYLIASIVAAVIIALAWWTNKEKYESFEVSDKLILTVGFVTLALLITYFFIMKFLNRN